MNYFLCLPFEFSKVCSRLFWFKVCAFLPMLAGAHCAEQLPFSEFHQKEEGESNKNRGPILVLLCGQTNHRLQSGKHEISQSAMKIDLLSLSVNATSTSRFGFVRIRKSCLSSRPAVSLGTKKEPFFCSQRQNGARVIPGEQTQAIN